jgi:hypothetical protein
MQNLSHSTPTAANLIVRNSLWESADIPTQWFGNEMCNKLMKMSSSVSQIAQVVCRSYVSRTPKTVKIIDVYLAFTAVVAALQFLYCSLVGTFPFNSFLAGFGCALGAFVLGGALRSCRFPPRFSEQFTCICFVWGLCSV